MKNILTIIFLLVLLYSCDRKEDDVRYSMSGVWEIESIESKYYTSGEEDSVRSSTNAGVILLNDNALDPYNNMEYDLSSSPPSFGYVKHSIGGFSSSEGTMGWYPSGEERLTFWDLNTDGITENYIIYTVISMKRNKMTLQFLNISQTSGLITYKEILELRRKG